MLGITRPSVEVDSPEILGANDVWRLNRNYCVCADQCEFTINQDIRGKEELQLFVRREVCAELR